jgi:hypothetical protein
MAMSECQIKAMADDQDMARAMVDWLWEEDLLKKEKPIDVYSVDSACFNGILAMLCNHRRNIT